ncbi:hypothetical protein F4823DRAFT_622903 [Ustulina deusta]|nr:hypothetical protein F4823DRAFT_622903 [Ustulina deusta]
MTNSSASFFDLSETRQPIIYASSTIPIFFSIVCVALRFWCRWATKAGLWIDDWLVFAALISDIGLAADTLWWIPRGLGKHIQTFGPNVLQHWGIGVLTAELTYTGSIVFVKLSVLTLYWRIFGGKTTIGLPIAALATTVLAWGITVFLLTLLQCIPTRGFWDKTIKASCNVESGIALLVTSIPNVVLDLLLLVLPIRYVTSLNLSKRQRTAIISFFLMGGLVCIASILRLVSTVPRNIYPDPTWNTVDQAIWADLEADFAIISACLPTMRPFWLAIRPKRVATGGLESLHQSDLRALPRKQKGSLWRLPVLMFKNNDEDSRLFSHLDQAEEANLGESFRRRPQEITTVDIISLTNNSPRRN